MLWSVGNQLGHIGIDAALNQRFESIDNVVQCEAFMRLSKRCIGVVKTGDS